MTSSSNGYFKMNNALFEAVYHSELTLMQKEILMLVIRFTDGYHRDIADLSYSFISQGIGRDKRHVIRNVNELIKKRVLFREDDMKINKLGVNKNIKEWDVIFRDSGSAATTSSGLQAISGSGLQATSGSGSQATEEIITAQRITTNNNPKRASRSGDQSFPSLWDAYPKSKRDEAGKRFIKGKILEEIEENAEAVQAALEIYLSDVQDPKYLQKASDFFRGNWKQYAPEEEPEIEPKGKLQ